MLQSHIVDQNKLLTEGALHKNCATFTQKKAVQFYLESEREKSKNPHNTLMRMDHQWLRGKQ